MKCVHMKRKALIGNVLIAGVAAAFAAACTTDSTDGATGNARVQFASQVIRDWQADGERAIYVERAMNEWYRAEFMGPCIGLQYQTNLAFDFGATDTFDKFAAVIVDGQRCTIKSVTKIEGRPPGRNEKKD